MKKIIACIGLIGVLAGCGGGITSSERNAVCNSQPKILENGRKEHPRAAKYEHLKFLGQLFTASQCGDERLKQIDGVFGENYMRGSTLFLLPEPDERIITLLREIGYSCVENKEKCTQWGLNGSVKVDELLKLEPYADKIREDL